MRPKIMENFKYYLDKFVVFLDGMADDLDETDLGLDNKSNFIDDYREYKVSGIMDDSELQGQLFLELLESTLVTKKSVISSCIFDKRWLRSKENSITYELIRRKTRTRKFPLFEFYKSSEGISDTHENVFIFHLLRVVYSALIWFKDDKEALGEMLQNENYVEKAISLLTTHIDKVSGFINVSNPLYKHPEDKTEMRANLDTALASMGENEESRSGIMDNFTAMLETIAESAIPQLTGGDSAKGGKVMDIVKRIFNDPEMKEGLDKTCKDMKSCTSMEDVIGTLKNTITTNILSPEKMDQLKKEFEDIKDE